MVYDCIVPGCKNYSNCKPNLHFHGFPFGNQMLLKQWVHNINRPNWTPTKNSRICSDHFAKNDYIAPQFVKLNSNVVPSLLLPVVCVHDEVLEVKDVVRHQPIASTSQKPVIDQGNPPVPVIAVASPHILFFSASPSQQSGANQSTTVGTQTSPMKLKRFIEPSPTEARLRKKIRTLQKTIQRRDKKIYESLDLLLKLKKSNTHDPI